MLGEVAGLLGFRREPPVFQARVAEDLDGARHLADLVAAGDRRDVDAEIAAGQIRHDPRQPLDRLGDAADHHPEGEGAEQRGEAEHDDAQGDVPAAFVLDLVGVVRGRFADRGREPEKAVDAFGGRGDPLLGIDRVGQTLAAG